MTRCRHRDLGQAEAGGITIVVALMLLVLLTIAAVAMSRNSLREIVTSGFTRQGAMAANVADSGIEWSVYWIFADNSAAAAAGSAQKFAALKAALLKDPTLAGVAKDITSSNPAVPTNYVPGGTLQADLSLPNSTSVTAQGFTLGLTAMGQPSVTDNSTVVGGYSPGSGSATSTNAGAPMLWAIRSDSQVNQGSIVFIHAKEAWILNPI